MAGQWEPHGQKAAIVSSGTDIPLSPPSPTPQTPPLVAARICGLQASLHPVSCSGCESGRNQQGEGHGTDGGKSLCNKGPAGLPLHPNARTHMHTHTHTHTGSPAHSTGLSAGLTTERSWVRSPERACLEAGSGSRASRASFLGKSPNE